MKSIYLLFSLLILNSCDSQRQKQKESTRLSQKSKTLLEEEKFEEARLVIEKAIRLDPTNYAAFNNRAFLNIKKKGSSDRIIADLQKSLTILPSYEISLYTLTNYYFSLEDYEKTIENANTYLDYSTKQVFDSKFKQDIYAIMGESKYMKRQFEDAKKDLQMALSIDSNDAGVHKNLGDCYFYTDSIEAAIQELTKAINLEANYYQAYLGRARCYEAQTSLDRRALAERDYKIASKINPQVEDIYFTNSLLFKKYKTSNE